MKIFHPCFSKENLRFFLASLVLVAFVTSFSYVNYAAGESFTLTVTVNSTLSFSTSTDNFNNLDPGVAQFATTTLAVTTNNVNGWNVTLYGDDQENPATNTVCDLNSNDSVGLTDQTEWIIPAAAATSTADGNAVRISVFDNSGDVLAFRVMTASGSVPFRADSWWGTADDYADNAATLWAGVASGTPAGATPRRIGSAGAGSYSASTHLNTVLYYLDAPASQQTGAYGCPLTYTATAN